MVQRRQHHAPAVLQQVGGMLLRRQQLRKRKITAVVKARPSVADVPKRFAAIHQVIECSVVRPDLSSVRVINTLYHSHFSAEKRGGSSRSGATHWCTSARK